MYIVLYIQKVFFTLVDEFNSLYKKTNITQKILPGFNSESTNRMENLDCKTKVMFPFILQWWSLNWWEKGNQVENPYFVSDDLLSVSLETELGATELLALCFLFFSGFETSKGRWAFMAIICRLWLNFK